MISFSPVRRWTFASALTALAVTLFAAVACTSGGTDGATTSPTVPAAVTVTASASSTEPTGTPSSPSSGGAATQTAGTEPAASTVVPATQAPLRPTATATVPGPPVQQEPASNRIAIASADGSVYTIDPDGSNRQLVSIDSAASSGRAFPSFFEWPVWSPDSRYLLLTAITPGISGGFETSLLRAGVAPPGAAPLLLFGDVPGTAGIGGGVAHFPVWRPDGGAVALIANTGPELATFLIDVEAGVGSVVSTGAPVYLDWSRDGSHMLVHTVAQLVLHGFDSAGGRAGSDLIGTGSASYRAPKFSPVSNDYLYVDIEGQVRSLFKGTVGVPDAELITTARAGSAFSWAPGGDRVAFADGNRAGFYDMLRVIDMAGSADEVVVETPILAFWWSPDGTRLLVVTLGGEPGSLALGIVDASTGEVDLLGLVEPSPEMGFVISFFDQYAADLQLWSPDSTLFVFAGILMEGLADAGAGTVVQFGDGESSVWVIDPAGERPPVSLGLGSFGTWSPD